MLSVCSRIFQRSIDYVLYRIMYRPDVIDQSLVTGLYLSDFHWGGSEFRLATSDYSGHGGCQIGTVEYLAKLDHVGLYRGVSGVSLYVNILV